MIRYLRAVMAGLEPGIPALLADEAAGINKTNHGIIDKRLHVQLNRRGDGGGLEGGQSAAIQSEGDERN
jgi:hypothetical protein